MEVKLIEVRDRMTTMPVLAISLEERDERERWLLARGGYGPGVRYVLFVPLTPGPYDPYEQKNITTKTAHFHLLENWDSIKSGDVVDAEYVRGESAAPKTTDQKEG